MTITPMNRLTKENQAATLARKRAELQEAAVSYVRDGKDGTMHDRLRMASEMSGIARHTIEAAVGNLERLKVDMVRKQT